MYLVLIRRNRTNFVVSAPSADAAVAAVNADLRRLKLRMVDRNGCVVTTAMFLEGEQAQWPIRLVPERIVRAAEMTIRESVEYIEDGDRYSWADTLVETLDRIEG